MTAVCPCSGLSGNNTARFDFFSFLCWGVYKLDSMKLCPREGANARGSEAAKNKWMLETAKLALSQLKPKVTKNQTSTKKQTNKSDDVDV